MAFALRHAWHQAGMLFWISLAIMAIAVLVAWGHARRRNIMDVTRSDFIEPSLMRGRLIIVVAVCSLAALFALSHLHQIHHLLGGN
ncbi:hypothetical protein TUM12370_37790 [Salmonella enterica subsp. enterica serovar Choleraesuis]|nr:hypothetical protein TUM12370_37790 [Salmonella enterica subsp. enterica serovar Choleraesuis]